MTELTCGVARDLLPLYADNLTGEESSALLEAHLAACGACQNELGDLRASLPVQKTNSTKTMRTVKQKLRARRILVGVGSGLGAAVLLFGLFLFLINYMIPVKTPPDDLQFSVTDGVFRASSSMDSQFSSYRMGYYLAQDGSTIYQVVLSMQSTLVHNLWPALDRMIYPPNQWSPPPGVLLEHDIEAWSEEYDDAGNRVVPYYNTEGKGLWLVYFIQESDYQKRRISSEWDADRGTSTGRLTEESMQYATLVWEETVP